jgi:transposase
MSAVHRVRQGYIKERTACMSRIGALLLEFGVSLPRGHSVMKRLFQWLAEHAGKLPAPLITELAGLHAHYDYLSERIAEQDIKLKQQLATQGDAQLLKSIPGIGDITASQCVAELGNAEQFKNGRDLAAWLGLVPHQHSTGGKPRLLGISKRGNKHLRTLFIHGARAILARPEKTGAVFGEWLIKLRATKPFNVACVALANKLARIVWSVLRTKEQFNAAKLQPAFA